MMLVPVARVYTTFIGAVHTANAISSVNGEVLPLFASFDPSKR